MICLGMFCNILDLCCSHSIDLIVFKLIGLLLKTAQRNQLNLRQPARHVFYQALKEKGTYRSFRQVDDSFYKLDRLKTR